MKTLQDRLVDALLHKGYALDQNPRGDGKYTRLFRVRKERTMYYWYVGRNGALRTGKSQSTSISCSDKFKAKLLEDHTNSITEIL